MGYQVALRVSCWGESSGQALESIRQCSIPQGFGVEIHCLDAPTACESGRHHRLKVGVEGDPGKALEVTVVVARLEDRFRGVRQ